MTVATKLTEAPVLNLAELTKPLAEDEIEWKIQTVTKDEQSALVVPYPTARTVMSRLDAAFGHMGWSVSYDHVGDKGVLCTIVANGTSKTDGAEQTDIEPFKGGLSSALKRAGVAWGIGRELYKMDQHWVQLGSQGSHTVKCKSGAWKKWTPPKAGHKSDYSPAATPISQTNETKEAVQAATDVLGAKPANLGVYVFPKGKFEGMTFEEVGVKKMQGWLEFFGKKGDLKGWVAEAYEAANAWLASKAEEEHGDDDSDIPF